MGTGKSGRYLNTQGAGRTFGKAGTVHSSEARLVETQEYKASQGYGAVAAVKACECAPIAVDAPPVEDTPVISVDKLTLFITSDCPNCCIARALLHKAGLEYEVVVADQEVEKARAYNICQTPTLVVSSGANAAKLTGLSAIRRYLEDH